jgi:4-amino-4-deoxy-L-arabinose transferase-like glycosyltransferase
LLPEAPVAVTDTRPTPALVSQRAAERLPRLALLLFCAAYLLPGLFGRDPWKNADIAAYGYMTSLLRGDSDWLHPSLAGLAAEGGVLPYWIGAGAMALLTPLGLDPALAARIPFTLLLAATMALVWYATLHLARTEAAQPLAFAFGGEAHPIDYARAIADGALLALIAALGLLQLGHETTPDLVQLAATALLLYGLAASPYRPWQGRIAVLLAPALLAASGAATTGLLLALAGTLISHRSSYADARRQVPWLLMGAALAVLTATVLETWAWRLAVLEDPASLLRLLLWFTWPVWPLAGWTLWRWRRQLLKRHLSVPLSVLVIALSASVGMGGSDRALMLALPALAIMAAFALPTLRRSVSAAIDWFSVFFFSACALTVWVIYLSMHLGIPAQPARNIARLAAGFQPVFQPLALVAALAGSLAWLALVHWRTGRHRQALWKSLVLPAGGVALSWLLTMTLLLPVLDYARSYRPLVSQIATHVPPGSCLIAPEFSRSQLAALEVHGHWTLARDPRRTDCRWMVAVHRMPAGARMQTPPTPQGWMLHDRVRRPTDRDEVILIYRRKS